MKHSTLIAGALAAAALFASVADANAAEPRTYRGQLVHRIVAKWGGHVQEAYRADVRAWARDMGPVFARAPIDALRRAAAAQGVDAKEEAYLTDDAGRNTNANLVAAVNSGALGAPIKSRLLGQADSDLVFVPVTPCRVIDTRLAGGPIAGNTIRDFDITSVTDFSFQGGAASDCGFGGAGSFAAAAINFTTVTPDGAGYITAFPLGGTQPLAATVNYAGNDIRGNLAIVRLDQGAAANEMSVYSFAGTHLVADIVGYFINPQLGGLDCTEVVSAPVNLAAGAGNTTVTPACGAGYTIVGGGCSVNEFDGRIVSTRTFPGANNHFCSFFNQGAVARQGIAYGRCCKLPTGR